MVIITAKNIKKSFGPKLIFENVSFDISDKDRIALVGRNGTGKTTILKILTDNEDSDEGEIFRKKDIDIGYLEQEPDYGQNLAIDVIKSAKLYLNEIDNNINNIIEKLSQTSDEKELTKLSAEYDKLLEKYAELGGYQFESDVAKVSSGLGVTEKMQSLPFNKLSGGEKTRVLLAKLLLEEPDLLLLDEPTNHLDIESMEWLEKYLNDYKGAVLLVSHDRYFLDSVVNKVYELDTDGIETYDGNYTRYALEKEYRYLSRLKSYNSQQFVINRMESQIKKFRALNTPGLNKKANEIEHRLEKMSKLPKPILEKKAIKLSDNSSDRTGNDVLVIENVSKSFGNKQIINNSSLKMRYKDRIGIIGNNGCGKTTLIKMILGQEPVDSGIIKLGTNLKIGYLSQNVNFEEANLTILDYYCNNFIVTPTEARNQLAKILFTGNDVFKKIGSLSGGEKKRLQLSVLMGKNPNFIILDEPTNHLDLSSREILEENLSQFDGNLLIVSHDRYFLNKLATKCWVFDNGNIINVDGNYEYYRQNKNKFIKAQQTKLNSKEQKKINECGRNL